MRFGDCRLLWPRHVLGDQYFVDRRSVLDLCIARQYLYYCVYWRYRESISNFPEVRLLIRRCQCERSCMISGSISRTLMISLSMMFGRMGALIGNIVFPYLLSLGCLPPFLLVGLIMLGKCQRTVYTIHIIRYQ